MAMPAGRESEPAIVLPTYRVGDKPLYIVGTFERGVTVFGQQTRALNLVWALIEQGLVPCAPVDGSILGDPKLKIAVIGGGFTGLTVVAAMLKKQVAADITVFEERDTLLPLQQGSDSRWLHPRIYDWPKEGSDANVAMLPVLNWSAARASDVVVQILAEWRSVVTEHTQTSVTLYCNARHLQVFEPDGDSTGLQVEWVGEKREPFDGTRLKDVETAAVGGAENFDMVIMAIGFGLERDGAQSYWRNEILGQPSLDQPRRTYLVSGQGDGAMIDLLRLSISLYRQDRILHELFQGKTALLQSIRRIQERYSAKKSKTGLFKALENLSSGSCAKEFKQICDELTRRLRRDTEVILRLRVRQISELFESKKIGMSFQNMFLVFLLYKCGGFFPSTLSDKKLMRQHSIPRERLIRRHGTRRKMQAKRSLSDGLYALVKQQRHTAKANSYFQPVRHLWKGGYFDIPGPSTNEPGPDSPIRAYWRKEYLPGPTALIATSFCASLVGWLLSSHMNAGRLRVTLHRAITLGDEELLQQACDYEGTTHAAGSRSASARTFPARNATIGLAYRCRQIVRSIKNVRPEDLRGAMDELNLNAASRSMSGKVGFVLAMPILEPEKKGRFTAPNPVAGVIYIDSEAKDFFLDDEALTKIVLLVQQFLNGLERMPSKTMDRIRNLSTTALGLKVPSADTLPDNVKFALELVAGVSPPMTSGPFQFNFDHADFVPPEVTV